MTDRLTFACAQANPVMGDIGHNIGLAREVRAEAAAGGADLVLFSELFVCGYPPEDLVLKSSFVAACRDAVEELARDTGDGGPAVIVGTPWLEAGKIFNTVCLLEDGEIAAVRHKVNLPAYGAFEQARLFARGDLPGPIHFRGVALGVPICEDIWIDEVVECLEETGAELLLVPNGSPWWRGKHDLRLNVAVARVTESGPPLIYANQVGGQDELVFDGASFGLNGDRTLAFQMAAFETDLALTRWERRGEGWRSIEGPVVPLPDEDELTWLACVQGLRDFAGKNGYGGTTLELTGDVGSTVGAMLAADVLGSAGVRCTVATEVDAGAAKLALMLGLGVERTSEGRLAAAATPTYLPLGPVDRSSELLGRFTIRPGFNPFKDLYGDDLHRLAAWRSGRRPPLCLGPDHVAIPGNIGTADAPLPEDVPVGGALDAVLRALVDEALPIREVAARTGQPAEAVRKVEDMVFSAEYKRRQSAPGLRLLPPDQGRGRRWPMTNRFRDGGE